LQHVAENPKDFVKWFDVFYQIDDNVVSAKIITRRQQETLRDNLSRFLESYMYNTGLDFVSGVIRLLLDEYSNTDGKARMESSLVQIAHWDKDDVDYIIERLLRIGKAMDNKNKSLLAESLYKYFNNETFLLIITKELGDSYSMSTIIELATRKLTTINEKIYGGFRKVG
jgi:ATP-dependent DNA helicase RecQ